MQSHLFKLLGIILLPIFHIGCTESPIKIPLERFILAEEQLTMEPGNTHRLKVIKEPANTNDTLLIWETNNPDVVIVDENGLITAIGKGEAYIKVSSENGALENTCRVNVFKITEYELNNFKTNYESSIICDSNGYTWLAGESGVLKFNGNTSITMLEGKSISDFAMDSKHNIYACTSREIYKYGNEMEWVSYKDSMINKFTSGGFSLRSFSFDNNDDLWINATLNNRSFGLIKITGEQFTTYTITDDLAGKYISSVLFDSAGNAWAGTMNGISMYDNKDWTTSLENNLIMYLSFDESDQLWAATAYDGAYYFDGTDWVNFNPRNSPVDYFVSRITPSKGGVWVFHSEGLSIYKNNTWSTINTQNNKLLDIRDMQTDTDGNIWASSPFFLWKIES